jgi:deoxyribodipyrimidine photolyase-related protein
LDVLVDNGKPVGGQWSFDHENRKKIPKGVVIPSIPTIAKSKYFADVDRIISTHFSSHPGNLDTFFLPVTYGDSVIWMLDFFSRRFSLFGPYEDAILSDEAFLFHSQLSALINVGLLTPKQVVDEALAWFRLHPEHIASVEGFIRQIIGWREFIRGVYHTQHLVGNHFNHTRRLTADWYNGTTGIDPLDDVIKRVDTFAYAHHIERLMVVGNIMLLSEIHPDDVYKWFMEMFVDSSDWVMLPNVYGMSQFADGGVFATKPYICGSNYILKMSDYAKGEWCDILDGLYWRFINKHREFFLKNPRLSMMVSLFDKMDEGKKKRLSVAAERFLAAKTL